ncbi:hypothetical protein LTR37_004307 [Vermiconidia calcicola]|uniref:Uncharacterized protein n=1 Tax=Vermiconidia calcicola TaxID=1690605 RepID=A0ACC3NN65_9PEZI|nr:hypothetical protein LTR37_004307 [Vermiconidia calcicola]
MASSDSHSRVSSEHDEEPARLSALYQYHNAPEVAPAHGLEYDDTPYPVSDKFPVVRETKYGHGQYTGKHAYANDNRPPRIIFGMKIKTFLIVAAIMIMIVVGAAVGGAVGGKDLHTGQPVSDSTYGDMSGNDPSSSSAATSPTPSTTTTYSAPTPTFTPMSDCPTVHNQNYTSQYTQSSDAVPDGAGLSFQLHCDLQSPLSSPTAQRISQAYVYTFSDCVEVCAGHNYQNADSNCTFAVYKPADSRPANCWVGSSEDVSADSLKPEEGTEVAILQQPL